ncbi:MAG: hypothetical protein QOJ83_2017, partial [Frankiales bacterium]|nr:hypothetical protein [Frankiales bacterium]
MLSGDVGSPARKLSDPFSTVVGMDEVTGTEWV